MMHGPINIRFTKCVIGCIVLKTQTSLATVKVAAILTQSSVGHLAVSKCPHKVIATADVGRGSRKGTRVFRTREDTCSTLIYVLD